LSSHTLNNERQRFAVGQVKGAGIFLMTHTISAS